MKAFERERNYLLELRSYQRLKEHNVSQIDGFSVPQLVNSNDQLLIIEMSIVSPPYLIDFGKVSIDAPPDFSDEVLADEEEQAAELFGENWPRVQSLMAHLQHFYGIYYLDPKPRNILFLEMDTDE